MEIIWQGNPISCMKTFRQLNCRLCMRERLEILKMGKKEPRKLINSRSEIYGACRHKPRFHRYFMNGPTSADEGLKSRKDGPQPTGSADSIAPPPGKLSFCQPDEKLL